MQAIQITRAQHENSIASPCAITLRRFCQRSRQYSYRVHARRNNP
ncbi:hypothetical protein [Vibrio parahaemolyticus RIMD 2210633]|uniref:Uncharacterized protein n=1 Tax=Vibrio parahaemolyticus serotype O3:K6 (strain RIMD 2210633) TaxID=223926 RepID=Q87K71_VIBPA|nr:hypothetical protein [Vibrio parahaemolyticus RIMD 2210633]